MDQFYNMSPWLSARKQAVLHLSLSWCAGITIGVILAIFLKQFSMPLFSRVADYPISMIGVLVSILLPILVICILPVRLRPVLICLLIFMRGTCFAYTALCAFWIYSEVAWLMHLLLSFTNTWIAIPLILLCQRWMHDPDAIIIKKSLALMVYTLVVSLIDYFIVSPSMLML